MLGLFESVWGASTSTAEKWHAQGCRTLEDVQARDDLTNQQRVGLKCERFPPCRSLCESVLLTASIASHLCNDRLTCGRQVLRRLPAEDTACGGGKGALRHAPIYTATMCSLPMRRSTAHFAATPGLRQKTMRMAAPATSADSSLLSIERR